MDVLTGIFDGVEFALQSEPIREVSQIERSQTRQGGMRAVEIGPSLWRGDWRTVPMPLAMAQDLRTDLHRLNGGAVLFEMWDPSRAEPLAYAGEDLSGVTVSSVAADRKSVTLAGLPAGFVVSKSDWLSIDDGSNLHLVKALGSDAADGGGDLVDLGVFPAARLGIGAGANVNLIKASARWLIEPKSIGLQKVGDFEAAVTFSGVQVIA